ncbi:MAG: methyl-accepting chemotaxis protein [Methyloligellaceae bacterium]
MVEKLPVAVMTCDLKDFRIDYVNEATIAGLKQIEDALPCRAEEIVGQSIDIFHKHPGRQRKLLADPSNLPHRAEIEVGGEVLDLLVTPIHEGSRYVGPMLTWKVITEQKRAEAETDKLLSMLDDMPVNVMLVNQETMEIRYVNRTSLETLKPLQHLLPVPADQIVGQCIDIFHKNPEHQRAILSDPARLPYNAKIRLGDETLDLRVTAVNDREGNYIGPMLNWTVVSDRVALANNFENNVGSVVEAVTAAAAELEASAASMSSSVEEANAQAGTVASATDQLQSAIQEISQQVATNNDVAQKALAEASATNDQVSGLSEAAQTIGDVVNMIKDIAEQTNLLALNATIEAARAGEAGKGFAVVASEVKELATQTARATEEIAQQIEGIQSATGSSVEAIGSINSIITEMAQISSAIAAAVEEQSAATKQVADNITGITNASSETSSIATGVTEAAQSLSSEAEILKSRVDEFLKEVRAI